MLCLQMGPVDVILPDMVPLSEVADKLECSLKQLKAMSRIGHFPPLLKVSSKNYRVRADDLEEWLEGRWVTPESVTARADAIRRSIRQPESDEPTDSPLRAGGR